MPAHIIDSVFFRDQFGTAAMRAVFDDATLLQKWLDAEAALARVEAALGIIPADAAAEISRRARAEEMDIDAVKRDIDDTFHPIVPVIRELARHCGAAGKYIHWGATTQDIMDTAVALQLKDAYGLLRRDLLALEQQMIDLAERHRDTVMPGRTHGQQALPTTFGYKVAVWLRENRRHLQRLDACTPRVLVGQLGGAVGTLASIPINGLEVQRCMMEELGLGVPDTAWHTARDGLAEWVCILGMISATLGKIANEVINLQRNEIAELEEPFTMGKVGSSTMPHKRNPMMCEAVVAASLVVRQDASLALNAMVQEHERDMGPWQAEWEFVPRATIMTAGALALTIKVLMGLHVYAQTMARNLDATNGLLLSEAVMFALGEKIGRQEAHELVYGICMRAIEGQQPLAEALAAEPRVTAHLSPLRIIELLDPRRYTGFAGEITDRAVEQTRLERAGELVAAAGG
jgi:adenylosuccinate lyase